MNSTPRILFNNNKLYDLQLVPLTPECFTFQVYDEVLKTNIAFTLYRSNDVWELIVTDDRICADIVFDQYKFDKATNCFYTVDYFYTMNKP